MRETQNSKCLVPSFIISYCVWSKGIHPRHPPREFPLGLRAPGLGSRLFSQTAKRGRKEPLRQNPASSWGEDSPLPSALPRFVTSPPVGGLVIPPKRDRA